MAHERKRYLEPLLQKVLSMSPIAGVLGHRQVGKTTLLNQVCDHYYSLDKPEEQKQAQTDSELYLRSRAGKKVALDEVQTVPAIFKELKEWVRLHPKPGQFILSGSVRFTSRAEIKESLAGRILSLELLPMSIRELESEPNSKLLLQMLEASSFDRFLQELTLTTKEHQTKMKLIKLYVENGGLPGVCFIRDEKFRKLKIEEQIETILDRDLRLLLKTNLSLREIRGLLTALSQTQGQPLNISSLKVETQISSPTIKKLIYVLESLYIIRSISIEGSVKGQAIYFEDIAESNYFKREQPGLADTFDHLCFAQLRVPFHYQLGESTEIFQYRTRNGVCVPLCFRNKVGVLGVLPVNSKDSLNKALAGANSFLKTYSNSKVILTHLEHDQPKMLSKRVLLTSFTSLI